MWKEGVDFVCMVSCLNVIIVFFGILGVDDVYVNILIFFYYILIGKVW